MEFKKMFSSFLRCLIRPTFLINLYYTSCDIVRISKGNESLSIMYMATSDKKRFNFLDDPLRGNNCAVHVSAPPFSLATCIEERANALAKESIAVVRCKLYVGTFTRAVGIPIIEPRLVSHGNAAL